jgi:spore germination cell wall hydrolase CwlJ-like protein
MFRYARAIGYAAAATLVASSPTFANPTLGTAPLTPTFLSHTVSMPDAGAATDQVEIAPPAEIAGPASEVSAHLSAAIDASPEPQEFKLEGQSLGELVTNLAEADSTDDEHECLAGAIYFEAKGEPLEGQLAVAEVVINRSKSGRFPSTICGVVKQKSQFSFIRAGRFPPIQRGSAAWRKAIAIAHVAMQDLAESRAGSAMFFHATYVSPGWRGLTRVAKLGNHVFYR